MLKIPIGFQDDCNNDRSPGLKLPFGTDLSVQEAMSAGQHLNPGRVPYPTCDEPVDEWWFQGFARCSLRILLILLYLI